MVEWTETKGGKVMAVAMAGWISVGERLPENHAWVLVYADGAINCMGYTPEKGFEDWVLQQAPNIVIQEITYWRPLPDGPTANATPTPALSPHSVAIIREALAWMKDLDQDMFVHYGPKEFRVVMAHVDTALAELAGLVPQEPQP